MDFAHQYSLRPNHYLVQFAIAFGTVTTSLVGTCSLHGAPPDPATLTPAKLQQEVRSILSNRCFACHGPDESKIEGGLRLDDAASATKVLDSGKRAIIPGDPSGSELLRRVSTTDASERMPPSQFAAPLNEREVALLRHWIEKGGTLSKHWSFASPNRPNLPSSPEGLEAWSHNAIDRFVLAKMLEKGLTPSPEADRVAQIRRVTLDLTGLPPTLHEIDSFVASTSPHAYEELVDRLLASPFFGEHWARKWLDLARYADSAGYADDPARTIWGYRDWVIRSINQDLPFDRFSMEQLAGDLLPNPSQDQLVATAFHRNTLTNNEGGTNDEEFRNVAVVDRVNTTMSVWMGLTMACAQCHNHKYDPISQKEYFQVFSLFNQSQDADKRDESPKIDLMSPLQLKEREQSTQELEGLKKELLSLDPSLDRDRRRWEESLKSPVPWLDFLPSQATTASGNGIESDPSGILRVDSKADRDTFDLKFPLPSNATMDQLKALQIETIPDPQLPGGGAGSGNGNFVVSRIQAELESLTPRYLEGRYLRIELMGKAKILSLAEVEIFTEGENIAKSGKATQSSTDFGGDPSLAIDGKTSGKFEDRSTTHTASSKDPWWELDLQEVRKVDRVIVHNRTDDAVFQRLDGAKILLLDQDRKERWSTTITKATQAPFEQAVVDLPKLLLSDAQADYEQPGFAASGVLDQDPETGWGVGGAIPERHTLSLLVKPADPRSHESLKETQWTLKLRIECRSKHSKHVLSRFRVRWSDSQEVVQLFGVPAEILSVVRMEEASRTPADQAKLATFYQSKVAPSLQPLRNRIAAIQKKIESVKPITSVPIMQELPKDKQRRTFIQLRGNYKAEGEPVNPSVPTAFHAPRQSDRENGEWNRLRLAEWIMQKENPLTPRVTVNRLWESLFGLGLVRTSEEFGSQGDLPSHPELLDWLATEILRQEWNTKSMLRMIVTSSTYRQQSHLNSKRLEVDPENVYLSRGPRIRMTAEQVRDQALAAAGLLSHTMFGEPVRPRQPEMGLKAAFGSATDWERSPGEHSYRRGIYTTWRRSNPYPSMATFDAPNREVCTLRRDRTNTPLQALVTLNDPVYVEAAQALARRILVHEAADASTSEQLNLAFRWVTSRNPLDRERESLIRLLQESMEHYQKDVEGAKKLATDPLGPLPERADPALFAAWTVVSNVLLNLDEVLMTR